MQNHCHPNIDRTSVFNSRWLSVELLSVLKKLCNRNFLAVVIAKAKETAIYLITTLGISGIFLGGTYFFLHQLAEHGW